MENSETWIPRLLVARQRSRGKINTRELERGEKADRQTEVRVLFFGEAEKGICIRQERDRIKRVKSRGYAVVK